MSVLPVGQWICLARRVWEWQYYMLVGGASLTHTKPCLLACWSGSRVYLARNGMELAIWAKEIRIKISANLLLSFPIEAGTFAS
jgi:hypothetical protein